MLPFLANLEDRPAWQATFCHGDLGGNMKWDGSHLIFIDWERTGFLEFSELGYIFVHGGCPPPLQKIILEIYAGCRGIDRDRLQQQVDFEMSLLNIDVILWRANRYTEALQAGSDDADRHLAIAHERLLQRI